MCIGPLSDTITIDTAHCSLGGGSGPRHHNEVIGCKCDH